MSCGLQEKTQATTEKPFLLHTPTRSKLPNPQGPKTHSILKLLFQIFSNILKITYIHSKVTDLNAFSMFR